MTAFPYPAFGASLILGLATGALAQGAAPTAAPEKRPQIALELNKLEPAGAGCRAYFVVENRTADPVRELRLDTFIFDGQGVIVRRLGLAFPDLRPERTKVVPFDISTGACPEIGRLLVNDVLACTSPAGTPVTGCGDLLAVTSRVPTRFEY